jgi:glycosyltransferase involved in cell wall biosynthesis
MSLNNNFMISVIIPIYNEEKNIPILMKELIIALETYPDYEIIFVNDGSADSSENLIKEFCLTNSKIKLINLSRNFGHQEALTAGLENANGDAVVMMDGDMQDPPSLIPKLIEKWQDGYEVVYTIKKKRNEPFLRKFLFKQFYKVFSLLSEYKMPMDSGIFSLIDKKVLKIIISLEEKNKYITGLRYWVGFNQGSVEFERPNRLEGEPKQTFSKLFKLAMDGIFSFSNKPLELAFLIGMIITAFSFLLICLIIYIKLFTTKAIPGYATYTSIILFMGGINIFISGILGRYISMIFKDTKNRPIYLIKNKVNL